MNVVAVFRTGEDHWQREREEDGRERPGEIACHGFCRGTIGQPGDEEATTHVTEWGQAGGETQTDTGLSPLFRTVSLSKGGRARYPSRDQ